MKNSLRIIPVVGFLILCFAAAGLGGWLTNPGIAWLGTLRQPPFQPPNWIFGPVWTLLYAMMALSGAFVYSQPYSTARTTALILFGSQLALNVGWSLLFFYLRLPFPALVEILVLLAVIAAYARVARAISATAAILFIPYLLWVGFATLLTASLWYLNRN